MKTERSKCPLVKSLDIFGDRWTLVILRDIIFSKKTQYRQFLRSPEKIATNILANRLSRLVEHGILVKQENLDDKKVSDFYLTTKGMELIPIVVDIFTWGLHNIPSSSAPPQAIEQMESDRERYISQLKKELIRA